MNNSVRYGCPLLKKWSFERGEKMKKDLEQLLYKSEWTNLKYIDSDSDGYTYEATNKHGRTYIVFIEVVKFDDYNYSYVIQPIAEETSESYKRSKRKKVFIQIIGWLSFIWLILTFITTLFN